MVRLRMCASDRRGPARNKDIWKRTSLRTLVRIATNYFHSRTQYHKSESTPCLPRWMRSMLFVAHPCNMKEFKLYVGMNKDNMSEVLHSGLKNDSIPETFPVKHFNLAGVCFPTRYVKIVPLS